MHSISACIWRQEGKSFQIWSFWRDCKKTSAFTVYDNQTYSSVQNKNLRMVFYKIGNVSFQYLSFMFFCFLFMLVFIFLFMPLFIFIQISYLATSWPTLDHWRRGSFTHSKLITAQLLIRPEGQWEALNKFGSWSPAKLINKTQTGNLLILK